LNDAQVLPSPVTAAAPSARGAVARRRRRVRGGPPEPVVAPCPGGVDPARRCRATTLRRNRHPAWSPGPARMRPGCLGWRSA